MKKILFILGHNRLTGVNTWAVTLGDFLIRRGYIVDFEIKRDIDYNTKIDGIITQLQTLKTSIFTKVFPDYNSYDYCFVNYNIHQKFVKPERTIFVSHGSMYEPYRPLGKVYKHVAVTGRSQEILNAEVVINNGIDLDKFSPTTGCRNHPRTAINIFRGIPNYSLYKSCENLGIQLSHIAVEDDVYLHITKNDFVVGYGRSCYEGMAMGKPVLVHGVFGHDGWIKPENFETFLFRNCSGWSNHLQLTLQELQTVIEQYNPEDGPVNRKLAEKYLSAELMTTKFEELF